MAREPTTSEIISRLHEATEAARQLRQPYVLSAVQQAMERAASLEALRSATIMARDRSIMESSRLLALEIAGSTSAVGRLGQEVAGILASSQLDSQLLSSVSRTAAAIDIFKRDLTTTGGLFAWNQTVTGFSRTVPLQLLSANRHGESPLSAAMIAREVTRQFDLVRASTATVSMMAALQPTLSNLAAAQAITAARLAQPGFQSVAMLGLEGLAPQGVVSDVLRYYGEEAFDDAPIFGDALGTIRRFDQQVEPVPGVIDGLYEFWARISQRLQQERDPVVRVGLLELASFLVTVLAFLVSLHTDLTSPSKKDMDGYAATAHADANRQVAHVDALRDEVASLRADARDRERHLRFVRAPSPLRAEPRVGGLVLLTVYSDQALRAVDERGAWVKVEVFAYSTDKATVGWINRRNLARVRD